MLDELFAGFTFPAAPQKSVGVTTKNVEALVQPADGANPNGEFELLVSGFDPDEWMPLPSRLHVDTDFGSAEGLSVPNTAGSGVPEITDDGDLIIRGVFASTDHGQMIRRLVNEGHLWEASLLCLTHADGRRELLNGTFAGVPDPNAPKGVVVNSKSVSNGVDRGVLRSVHDLSVAFGAECHCKQSRRSRVKARGPVDGGVARAAVIARAGARARRFALDQQLSLTVIEANSAPR